MKKNTLSIIALIATYLLIIFFPVHSGDDNTYFDLIKLVFKEFNGSDYFSMIILMAPFISLITQTVIYVMYIREKREYRKLRSKVVIISIVTIGLFATNHFSLKYHYNTNYTLTDWLVILLLAAFTFSFKAEEDPFFQPKKNALLFGTNILRFVYAFLFTIFIIFLDTPSYYFFPALLLPILIAIPFLTKKLKKIFLYEAIGIVAIVIMFVALKWLSGLQFMQSSDNWYQNLRGGIKSWYTELPFFVHWLSFAVVVTICVFIYYISLEERIEDKEMQES